MNVFYTEYFFPGFAGLYFQDEPNIIRITPTKIPTSTKDFCLILTSLNITAPALKDMITELLLSSERIEIRASSKDKA